MRILIIALLTILSFSYQCIHEKIIKNKKLHVTSLPEGSRMLQATNIDPIRFYINYNQAELVLSAPLPTPNPALSEQFLQILEVLKHLNEVAATFFHSFIKVRPLQQPLVYSNPDNACNGINIPPQLRSQGRDVDYGVIVGVALSREAYVAKSIQCQILRDQSGITRPIWGSVVFNLLKLNQTFQNELTTTQFQTLVFATIHQFTHFLAFSSNLYGHYNGNNITGNVKQKDSPFQMKSPSLSQEILKYYNCSAQFYQFITERDFSHWNKIYLGDQMMISQVSLFPYISHLTASLFEISGWYHEINYDLVEPTIWGKNKGCPFVKKQHCNFEQFCKNNFTNELIDCDWNHVGYGQCKRDIIIQKCQIYKTHISNQCINENYLDIRQNKIQAGQSGGKYSRCFRGNFRKKGQISTRANNRCYQTLCLPGKINNTFIVAFKLENRYLFCSYPGQTIRSPSGYQGTITCPTNFGRICQSKQKCPYNCNFFGVCLNGKCLCQGANELTQTCQTPSSKNRRLTQKNKMLRVNQSIQCPNGQIFDPIQRKCQSCLELLSCPLCNDRGCIECSDGSQPISGRCS